MKSGKQLQEEIENQNNVDLTPTVRKEGESIESFKKRRKERDQTIKQKLEPKPFHSGGTYVRPKRK